MQRLIIADAHLGQRPGDTSRMGDLLQRAADLGVAEVIYLGDCCQYLIGMEKFWSSSVREVLQTWKDLRSAGVRLLVVEGNRDFFLNTPEMAKILDWGGRQYEFEQGGRRFRLVHGDRVNRKDYQYRFWALVSKSLVARVYARLLPKRLAVAIVTGMEQKLATSNWRYRHKLPEEYLRADADAAWADGVHELLWGHFHCSWTWARENRSARVVPAWLGNELSLLIHDDGSSTLVDGGLTPSTKGVENSHETEVETRI